MTHEFVSGYLKYPGYVNGLIRAVLTTI